MSEPQDAFFLGLIKKHTAELRGRIRSLWPRADVDDILQEVFLKAWDRHNRIGKLEPEDARAYLFTIVRTLWADRGRKTARWQRFIDWLRAALVSSRYNVEDPADYALAAEEQSHVRATMQKLKPHDRELLELKYFCNLSNQEIAKILCTTPSVATMRIFRAVRKLRKLIQSMAAQN